ncbi:TPA: DMT family transporter [Vibrio vulnificus]|nr:EamA family transporter [Vibrio vulnificus]HAS6237095.1 EamA family transporter [Vibrio vulnificus]HAS6355700.1 EamA family transporter [Vibrio vulnificus]HAT8486595.1 EamA family transporter [Vibrio vulnificus]HAT8513654.1 EamA family transporter [Vibrio vulnificus]
MLLGYLAIGATLLLWSGFFLSLKGGAISALQPADIAFTRFVVPMICLLPIVVRARRSVASVPFRYWLGMFVGSGLPYLLVAGTAMQFVPVSHGSALVPGTLPLFVTGIAVLLFKQPLSQHRVIGLSLVVVGIGLFLVPHLGLYQNQLNANGQETTGHLLFLAGSLMWAIFTICARVANLNPLVASGVIAFASMLLLTILVNLGVLDSYLLNTPIHQWPWYELFGHLLVQGIGAGLLAAFTYLYAVKVLGAERSAAFGSATPVLATLLAIPIFGEYPDPLTWIALFVVSCGSLIASNVFMRHDSSMDYRPPQNHQVKPSSESTVP